MDQFNGGGSQPFVRCGKIHFGGSHFQLPCVIKSLSEDSAHLHLFSADQLPECFYLSVEMLQLDVQCTIISRFSNSVIVALSQSAEKPTNKHDDQHSVSSDCNSKHNGSKKPFDTTLPRLWVIEDDEDDCALLSDAFMQQGVLCNLRFFGDGQAYLDHLNASDPIQELSRPALTLLDLNMPRMDGLETLTQLRSDMRFRHLPVVIFTTSISEYDIQKTHMLGVTAYIPKPSGESELNDVVNFISSYWTAGAKFPSLKQRLPIPTHPVTCSGDIRPPIPEHSVT